MASSTSEPMAMQRPPKLIVLTVTPNRWSTTIESSRLKGMVTSEMRVVRRFMRKMKSTITTKMLPSSKACFTLLMELSMKRDWR